MHIFRFFQLNNKKKHLQEVNVVQNSFMFNYLYFMFNLLSQESERLIKKQLFGRIYHTREGVQGRHEPHKMVSVFEDQYLKLPLNVRIDNIEVINNRGLKTILRGSWRPCTPLPPPNHTRIHAVRTCFWQYRTTIYRNNKHFVIFKEIIPNILLTI